MQSWLIAAENPSVWWDWKPWRPEGSLLPAAPEKTMPFLSITPSSWKPADPKEIESYVMYLNSHPEEEERIRKAARYTAARFTWEQIVENLIQRLEYQAKVPGPLHPHNMPYQEKPADSSGLSLREEPCLLLTCNRRNSEVNYSSCELLDSTRLDCCIK